MRSVSSEGTVASEGRRSRCCLMCRGVQWGVPLLLMRARWGGQRMDRKWWRCRLVERWLLAELWEFGGYRRRERFPQDAAPKLFLWGQWRGWKNDDWAWQNYIWQIRFGVGNGFVGKLFPSEIVENESKQTMLMDRGTCSTVSNHCCAIKKPKI